jgi:hypothetical protein
MTDPDADLDPFLKALFAEARRAGSYTPDETGIAEYVVGMAIGGPSTAATRVRNARVAAALHGRYDLARKAASMRGRLARLASKLEDPAEAFARLTGRTLPPDRAADP